MTDKKLSPREQEFNERVIEASTLILNSTYKTLSTYFDPYIAVVALVRVAAVIAAKELTRKQFKTVVKAGMRELDLIQSGMKPKKEGPREAAPRV